MISNQPDPSFFEKAIHASTGLTLRVTGMEFISGGCINNTLKLETEHEHFFIKYNSDTGHDMFEKEFNGLRVLFNAGSIKVPEALGYGEIDKKKYLLLEFIDSRSPREDFWELFGGALAGLHKNNTAENFGLDHDNYIGSLPQSNRIYRSWIEFFIMERLEPQVELSQKLGRFDAGYAQKFHELYNKLPALLPAESPALLHGDLWSGNFMVGHNGEPVLIDPSVYYGHREIELSFTRMFGGFNHEFYKIYHQTYPLLDGFEERVDIYNLYPYLVHVNLFGTAYLGGVDRVIRKFC